MEPGELFPIFIPGIFGFPSRTGIRMAASFFPGARRETIVLSHGYGDNRLQMLPWVEFLHGDGYSVLTYDMRDRGESGGDAVTIGALEPTDLISALDYLDARRTWMPAELALSAFLLAAQPPSWPPRATLESKRWWTIAALATHRR